MSHTPVARQFWFCLDPILPTLGPFTTPNLGRALVWTVGLWLLAPFSSDPFRSMGVSKFLFQEGAKEILQKFSKGHGSVP